MKVNLIKSETLIKENKYNSIKIAIWIYFILWIFEGALRKWVLPSLASSLLIVRDPVAIYIIIKTIYLNVKFLNPYVALGTVLSHLTITFYLWGF